MNKTIEEKVNEALQSINLEERNEAIVYASERLKYPSKKIAELTRLTIATIKTYVKKFINLLERAIKRFEEVVNAIIETVSEKPLYFTYIIDYYSNKELTNKLALKVGKTAREVDQRNEENEKRYADIYRVNKVFGKVRKVFAFESENDALIFEDTLRDFYTRKKGVIFVPNDRFLNVEYNEEELKADKKVNAILNLLSLVEA